MSTQITISGGAFQDALGNPLGVGAYLVLQLTNDAVTTDASPEVLVCANVPIVVPLNSSGNVSGTVKLWSNAELSPSGTGYNVMAFTPSGMPAWRTTQTWVFNQTGGSSVDLGTMTPSSSSVVFPAPVLLNPAGNQAIASGNLTLSSGSLVLTSGNVTLSNGNQTLTAGNITLSSGKLSSAFSGVFSNTQMNENYSFLLNGLNPQTEWSAVQSGYATDVVTGGAAVPSSATAHNVNGVAGYVNNSSTSSNVVAGYFQARALVNGANVWGINPVVQDVSGLTSGVVLVHEFDIQPQNASSAYANGGIMVNLFAPNSGSYFTGITINAAQVGVWKQGYAVGLGAVGTTGDAFVVNAAGTATSSTNYASPIALIIGEKYWNGTASADMSWQLSTTVGTGTNPSYDTLQIGHNAGPSGISSTFGISYGVNFGLFHSDGTASIIAPSATTGTSYTATLPAENGTIVIDPSNGQFAINSSGKISTYNNVITFGNGIPCEVFQVLATGLTANYNSGSAKTLFTPSAAGMWRISFSQAITTAGSSSSTFPSLTLGWTDAGGIARTKTIVSTSTTNTTAVESDGTAIIHTNGSTAVTITSASYASSGGTAMAYALAVTAEQL